MTRSALYAKENTRIANEGRAFLHDEVATAARMSRGMCSRNDANSAKNARWRVGAAFAVLSRMKTTSAKILAGGIIASALAATAIVGGVITNQNKKWYRGLKKSRLNPPDAAFGPVWTALYAAMGVSAYRIWRSPVSEDRTRALRLWATQLGLNFAWSPLFFGAHKPATALVDLDAMMIITGKYMIAASKVDRTAAVIMLPYMGWMTLAGHLNKVVVEKNDTSDEPSWLQSSTTRTVLKTAISAVA